MSDKYDSQNNNNQIISLFSEYLLKEHRSDICKLQSLLSTSSLSSEVHHSIIVHFNFLCEFNSIFSERLLSKPEQTLNLLNISLNSVVLSNLSENVKSFTSKLRNNLHVRLTALPVIPEVHKNDIPKSCDVGKFVALRAIVSRVGPVQVLEGQINYRCVKCSHSFSVYANFENYYSIKMPRFCPVLKCRSTSLKRVCEDRLVAKNYQEIRVHEQFGCLTVGVMRRSICICLEDDLLECVKPGDDVVVNGVVVRRSRYFKENSACNISIAIKANFIENLSELKSGGRLSQISKERSLGFEKLWIQYRNFSSSLEERNRILRSICPEVYGMYLVKLSLALMLAGAPEWIVSSGQNKCGAGDLALRIRGNPHILLIGDPGTAKSVLLRGCTNLCDRAVLTAATGTTAAGLTATAVRDASGWTLDAGALVLADGGLCAIDEFTALHGAHRAAVHEAMEQQTISLAKAGLMARLNCRCSVLAAANPPMGYGFDGNDDFGLPTPLLSRFDLIWRLVDPIDSLEWDKQIANFVLNLENDNNYIPTADFNMSVHTVTNNSGLWSADRLKEYFVWIRDRFKPQLSMGAANLLQRYYVWQRSQMTNTNVDESLSGLSGRRTLRLMESLVRLTKAHARLMARNEAIVEDAVVVIHLVDSSLHSTASGWTNFGFITTCSKINTPKLVVSTCVPENAAEDYALIEKLVFNSLKHIKCTDDNDHDSDIHIIEKNEFENILDEYSNNNSDDELKLWTADEEICDYNFPLIDENQKVHMKPLVSSTQLISSSTYNDYDNNNTSALNKQKNKRFHYLSSHSNEDYSLSNKIPKVEKQKSDREILNLKNPLWRKYSTNSELAHSEYENNKKPDDSSHDKVREYSPKAENKIIDINSQNAISFGFTSDLNFDIKLTNADFEIDL